MNEKPTQKEYWSGKVGAEWAALADQLDLMLGAVANAALQRAAFSPGERVLDIGCGAGATSIAIARRVTPGGAVVGVDLSPQLLSLARRRAHGLPAEFIEADASVFELDPKADAAFSRFGVMFFDNPAGAFAHLRAQLRTGGRMVFICWRPLGENTWATTPIEALAPMLTAPLPAPDPDAPGPFSLADKDKIARTLADSGWTGVEIARWDGDIPIGGGADLSATADFLMRVGPCARAIADQALDPDKAKQCLIDRLAPLFGANGLALPAACWIVAARA